MNKLEKCFLSDLLPYDTSLKKNGDLKKTFNEYKLLLVISENAINAVKNRDFEKFDALVGENACQIRAVKIAMMAENSLGSVDSLKELIVNSKLALDKQWSSVNTLMKRGVPFKDLLQKEGLEVFLDKDELFLIESFMLSEAKELKISESFSELCRMESDAPKKLTQLVEGITRSFADDLVKKSRKLLAAASVDFVREQALYLKDPKLELICSKKFEVIYNDKTCIPMFWTYKTLLLSAEKRGVPLVFFAKFIAKDEINTLQYEETLCLQSDPKDQNPSYKEIDPQSCDFKKVGIIVQGVVCANKDNLLSKTKWKELIGSKKLEVILAGAADHRQYPNVKEDLKIFELKDKEFEDYKKIACESGYSLENPSLFFIQHVYPSTLGNVLKLKKEK